MLRIRFLITIILFVSSLWSQNADLSFWIADLKYSQEEGVKICEVQQGMLSRLNGYDEIEKRTGYISGRISDFIKNKFDRVFYLSCGVVDSDILNHFQRLGCIHFNRMDQLLNDPLFLSLATKPSNKSAKFEDFGALLIACPSKIKDLESFKKLYPGVLILDLASYPYWADKLKMSELFRLDPILEEIKPEWGVYPKHYSKELQNQIMDKIEGDLFVIKPRGGFKGNGVFIVDRMNLDKTLKKVLRDPKSKREYKYWLSDRMDSFIVEKFIPSDPVFKNGKSFDATMRVVFFLTYQEGSRDFHFIEAYWKLPKGSLEKKRDLNFCHKSLGVSGSYGEVSPEILEQVEAQLKPAMLKLYEIMLGE